MVDQAPAAPVIVVASEAWHPGVVGIVAGRLRERYRRPAIVIGVDAVAGVGKGSGRSQPGVNLGGAVQAACEAGLPVGVQVVGPQYGDRTTIHLARLLEREFQPFVPPPNYA